MNTIALKSVLQNVKKVENLFATNKDGVSYVEPLLSKSGLYIFLEDGGYSLSFVATGEVEIHDVETKKVYKGNERFEDKELMRSIQNGEVYTKYEVKKKNWFDIYIYDEIDNNGEIVEGFVFNKPIFSAIDLIIYLIDVLQVEKNIIKENNSKKQEEE